MQRGPGGHQDVCRIGLKLRKLHRSRTSSKPPKEGKAAALDVAA